ncbi:MAG TPA: heavy-metal-associated domain-containing protein [Candidatus Hydrogenedentes bacterium]|nr:heavy-metal-associated domain-containing protein [Candidatus Hydrogenedentota bacterium]
MIIDLLYFEGCPNYEPALGYIENTLRELDLSDIKIRQIEILTDNQAQQMKFLGSPTIQISGLDIEVEARNRDDYGFSCRLYRGGDVPAFEVLREAVEEAQLGIHREMTNALEPARSCASISASAETGYHRWAAGGSLFAAVAASACCSLPLGLLALGVSSGGIGPFFATTRPFFLGFAALALGAMVFLQYRNHRQKVSCPSCTESESRMLLPAYTWVMVLLAGVFAFLPTFLPDLVPNANANVIDSDSTAYTVSMSIEGMTCAGCSTIVEQTVAPIAGVLSALVDFDAKQLNIAVASDVTVSIKKIVDSLEANGFNAVLLIDDDLLESPM